nr:hypothetical protein Iba_chr09aCG16680 [Ipomoea batatas]
MFSGEKKTPNFDNVLGISPSRTVVGDVQIGNERDWQQVKFWRRGLPIQPEFDSERLAGNSNRKICYPECKTAERVQARRALRLERLVTAQAIVCGWQRVAVGKPDWLEQATLKIPQNHGTSQSEKEHVDAKDINKGLLQLSEILNNLCF